MKFEEEGEGEFVGVVWEEEEDEAGLWVGSFELVPLFIFFISFSRD